MNAVEAAQAKIMTEDQLLAEVRRICKDLGVLCYHTHRSERSEKGYPDCTIVGPNGVLFRELKRTVGKVSDDQVIWLAALQAAGADAGVWRPEHLVTSVIHHEILAISRFQGVKT